MLSATQAGLADPSISTVVDTTACTAPLPTSSTLTSELVARTREPTGTGAGKRTLLRP